MRIQICMNICVADRNDLVLESFGFMFFEINDFVISVLLLFFFFQRRFESDMLSSCTPFMVSWKATSVEKTSVILFGIYVNLNNSVMKTLSIVCLLLHRGMTTSRSPLIKLC